MTIVVDRPDEDTETGALVMNLIDEPGRRTPSSVPGTPSLADTVKLSDLVYAKILGRIRVGDFAVNDKLPTENELAEQLAVSRPIVREALARLRADGVVSSRRGSGTYVRQMAAAGNGAAPLRSIEDMRKCLEFRLSFEGETAFHAAAAPRYEQGRQGLHDALARLQASLRAQTIAVEDDFGFHHAVARASGNRFFEDVMLSMRDSISTGMGITPSFMSVPTPERLARLHAEHVDVFEAILANDPERAREAMRRHLANATQRVFQGVG